MKLILLTHQYPGESGEVFIDNEMKVLTDEFDEVIVFSDQSGPLSGNRFFPSHFRHVPIRIGFSIYAILSLILPSALRTMIQELKRLPGSGVKLNGKTLRIALMEMIKAKAVQRELMGFMEKEVTDQDQLRFYSYWHDYMALALAMMKKKDKSLRCVARAHGWDLYAERHPLSYLPFKPFIISHLDLNLSVSNVGKKVLQAMAAGQVEVSRLGTFPMEISKQTNKGFLLCSCSNIIDIKQLHLIPKILASLNLDDITWVHFGDGPLRQQVLDAAQEIAPDLKLDFRGHQPNEVVRKFYARHQVDLFVNVSKTEGVPVSIMEAMSAGIPVLAFDVGGIREIVNDENGILVKNPSDVNEAAMRLKMFIDLSREEREILSQNALSFWKANYQARINYGDFAKKLKSL